MRKAIRTNALLLFVSLGLSGCDFGYKVAGNLLCENVVTFVSVSPDDRYIATVYQRSCGATTGTITCVEVRPSLSEFKGRPEYAIFAVDWAVPIGLLWTDASHLRVQCIGSPGRKIFKQGKMWRDIAVTYEFYGQIDTESGEDSLKSKLKSPNGNYTARIYVRDLGKASGSYTHVSLETNSGLFTGGKAVIVAVKGEHEISVAWQDDKHLKVDCLDCHDDDSWTKEESWKDVTILY